MIAAGGSMIGLIRDPLDGSMSSTRVSALLCVLTACGVAISGMVLNREQATTVAGLLSGAAAFFFARAKAPEP